MVFRRPLDTYSQPPMKKLYWLILITLFITSIFIDREFALAIEKIRFKELNPLMLWLTDFGLLFASAFIVSLLFFQGKVKYSALAVLSFAISFESAFILKHIFEIPRPYDVWNIHPLTHQSQPSFPSLHTAFVFSCLPFLKHGLKRYQYIWFIFAVLIAFSRLYVGVHSLSDVIAGMILGVGVGSLVYFLEKKYSLVKGFLVKVKDKFELRRQIAHAITGIGIVVLLKLGWMNAYLLGAALTAGGIISLLSRKYELPLIKDLLNYFERGSKRYTFPGQGSFCLILGSFLAVFFLKKEIAMAAVTIVAIGDSITNIVGVYFGKWKNPFNSKKNLEGTLMAILLATLGAWYFVGLNAAFYASTVAMIIESLDIKIHKWKIDDNVFIPVLAGGVIMLI